MHHKHFLRDCSIFAESRSEFNHVQRNCLFQGSHGGTHLNPLQNLFILTKYSGHKGHCVCLQT